MDVPYGKLYLFPFLNYENFIWYLTMCIYDCERCESLNLHTNGS